PRRQHENRDIVVGAARPDGATKRETIEPRQHDVEHQQVVPRRFGALERGLAVADAVALVPFESQVQTHEFTDVRFVLDDEDARRSGHDFFAVASNLGQSWLVQSSIRRSTMTTKRIALSLGAGLLALGVSAGVYAAAQNTNQNPRPFMGRGMGPGGPMGPGGRGPMGMLPMLGRQLGITDAQNEQLKNIAASHRDDGKALADRERAARQALNEAVTADTIDEGL